MANPTDTLMFVPVIGRHVTVTHYPPNPETGAPVLTSPELFGEGDVVAVVGVRQDDGHEHIDLRLSDDTTISLCPIWEYSYTID